VLALQRVLLERDAEHLVFFVDEDMTGRSGSGTAIMPGRRTICATSPSVGALRRVQAGYGLLRICGPRL
jgi:hypothetical protein